MQTTQDQELYDYFLREMDYLRTRATTFADDYPEVAKELKLSQVKSSDPHVELLLQSFAYLSANVRRDMAAQANQLPNQMLAIVYPHLVKTIPSMFIVQADVSPKEAKFDGLKLLERGREFYANIHSSKAGDLRCRMTTTTQTALRPLKVNAVEFSSVKNINYNVSLKNSSDIRIAVKHAHTTLKVTVVNMDDKPTGEFSMGSLRFYINGEQNRPHSAYALYDLLANDCLSILIKNDVNNPGSEYQLLNRDAIKWVGYGDDETVLPFNNNSQSAYRIIQEYFYFPEKYLFFDLEGMDGYQLGSSFEVYFLLSALPNNRIKPNSKSMLLNAIPLVNLYTQRLSSVRLNERDHEYKLVGEKRNHAFCEVHTLSDVWVIPKEGDPFRAQPYAGIDGDLLHENERLYSTRTELSGLKSIPGTETYIAIHQQTKNNLRSIDDVLTVKARCTNRRLPESLRVGDPLLLVGPGPINTVNLLTKPTMHQAPSLNNEKPWRLMSNLVLNAAALDTSKLTSDDEKKERLKIFKSILHSYSNENEKSHYSQIDSITNMSCRRIVKNIGADKWRGLCKGMEVIVEVDATKFGSTSLHLFGEVLNRFFGLYANVNSFTQFKLQVKQEKGILRTWPPLAGDQTLL